MSVSEQRPTLYSSQADVWYLKQISFGPTKRPVKIITQNFNGPCSFIAICNILILRGHIEVLPHDRTTVSYEFLSQLVGEYLLINCPDIDISAALSIMPTTTKGLDLNPRFTSITGFSPASDAGELALFSQAGIQLVHGWVVDPESPEAPIMSHVRDYDSAVTLIADADYITKGRLLSGDGAALEDPGPSGVQGHHSTAIAGPSSGVGSGVPNAGASLAHYDTAPYSDEQRRKIEHAIVAHQFLDATKSQLTYHGLFQLASTLQPGALVALFRNAHLSVVYKSPGAHSDPPTDPGTDADRDADTSPDTTHHVNPNTNRTNVTANPNLPHDAGLYALVTDDVFLHEPTIVWERLEDIDGNWSTFVDSDFQPAVPIGGDVAGQTAEGALRRFEMAAYGLEDPADRALATQLQAEEDERARDMYQRRQRALAERRRIEEEERRKKASKWALGGRGKKKDCVIM